MAYMCKIASMEEMERKWIFRFIGILDLFIMSNKDGKYIRMGQRLMSGIMQKP